MGVGLGIAATGGLLIASEGDGDMGTAYTAAGLGILGAVVVGVGLLGYGVTSLQQRFPPPGASRKSTKP
jgi:hypothetical protein